MRVLAAVLAAWMLIALSACSGTQDQPDSQPEPDVSEEPVQPDPPPPSPEELAAAQVEELLSSLTLEEQVGQLFFVRCPADQALEDITIYHLGGYVLFTRDYQDDSGAWLTKDQFVQTLSDYQSAALADTVARYNELCAAGRDEDFGKAAKYLVPIEGGPYYAIPRGSNKLPAILGGLVVDSNHQCLNGEFEPISGLYAVGNAQGGRFLVDYPLPAPGISHGMALTHGMLVGRILAQL